MIKNMIKNMIKKNDCPTMKGLKNMTTLLLFLLAAVPPSVLMYYIFWMDQHEPESLKNVILAMLMGLLSFIAALIIQLSLENVSLFNQPGFIGQFYEAFFLVAPSEELAKFYFVYIFIKKKPFYNNINDGIVYYGAGALGFALIENIFYVFDNGFSVGIIRAFTSIPVHAFCGIIIGYHAGLARFSDQQHPRRIIVKGLFIAYITHASYNTILSAGNIFVLLFIPLVGLIYYLGYKLLQHGRQLSIAEVMANRSQEPEMIVEQKGLMEDVAEEIPEEVFDRDTSNIQPAKKDRWKIWISRPLLVFIGLIWILVFSDIDSLTTDFWELFFGMIIISFIPFMIGLLLEKSYQRRRKK